MEANPTTNHNQKPNKKQTKGKQKIEMKMIRDENDRLTTFSKRKSGIYKKANELVTLCGGEVGFITFSPSGKPFSYGNPSIDSVIAERLLLDQTTKLTMTDVTTHPIMEVHREMRINNLNQKYNNLYSHMEVEKERQQSLQKMPTEAPDELWEGSIEGLSLEELKQRQRFLEELHANISNHVKERMSRSWNIFNNKNNNISTPAATPRSSS
ncbi:MADS-box transcription factor [Parasponia andersonii]|uniref:MADS-box transcription factor n=1 Tax=Parasponia andersonii TaxID=3476 RepID=A0A2P5ATR3_PARAD|nr:MADS-box transcription factor [Parasponia andersonii]